MAMRIVLLHFDRKKEVDPFVGGVSVMLRNKNGEIMPGFATFLGLTEKQVCTRQGLSRKFSVMYIGI